MKRMNVKLNWKQTGMPVALVNRLGRRNEFAEFKTVLNDARNQILQPVDAEAMARELVESGGREYVDMVRELSTDLANTRRELEAANRRCERLVAELARRGIAIDEDRPERTVAAPADESSEWDEWNRKFQALLG